MGARLYQLLPKITECCFVGQITEYILVKKCKFYEQQSKAWTKTIHFHWRHEHISFTSKTEVSDKSQSTVEAMNSSYSTPAGCKTGPGVDLFFAKTLHEISPRAKLSLSFSSPSTSSSFLSQQFWTHWWWSLWRWNPVWETTNQMFYWHSLL